VVVSIPVDRLYCLVKQFFDISKAILVHIIDQRHFNYRKVKYTSSSSNPSVSVTCLVYLILHPPSFLNTC